MGKTSKKKKKNSDFVKPKLRVGKKKPAATNFTSIDFKSSAINILAQLEEKAEPTNRRNLSLKDILHQMDHYNDNTRKDATESLKNFFLQYPSSLHQRLSIVMPKLLSKSVDLHYNVRKNFMSCLEHIFQNVGSTEIQPFFPVIMAHLSCAMTHINEEIQTDSLKFLGLCLELFPLHFLENCEKVFHNFLDMVYQSQGLTVGRKNVANSSTVKSFNRDVLVKPIGKLSSPKVKKDILEKLLKIVSLVFTSNNNVSRLPGNMGHFEFPFEKSGNKFCLTKYGLLGYEKDSLACNKREVIFLDGAKAVKDTILTFIPALFQCWNDCKASSGTSSVMEDSSMQIMTSIASILRDITSSLAASSDMELFTRTYFYDFTKYFLENFPFSFNIAYKKQAKHPQQELSASTISLNISICEVYCIMIGCNQALALENSSQLKGVLGYIRSLSHDVKLNKIGDCLDSVQEMVCILLELLFRWESHSDVDKIFKSVYDIMKNFTLIYKESNAIATKLQLLPILEKLLHLMEILTCPTDCVTQIFESWVCLLPSDLQHCEPENSEFLRRVIAIILTVLSREQMPFDMRSGLHCAINHVIGAPKSIFTVATCELSLQRQFLEMIYYLPQLDMDLLKNLSFLCHHKETPMNTKSYIFHIVYYCLQKRSVDLKLFLMFLMSVLVGSSLESLENTQSLQEQSEFTGIESLKYKTRWNFKSNEDEAHVISDHVKSCKVMLDLVETLDCRADILLMLLPTLDQLLTNFRVLPNVTVLGLLFLIYRLQEFTDLINQSYFMSLSDKLAELLFSVVIYHAAIDSNEMKSYQWNQTAFNITCKLLCFNHHFLSGWVTTAIAARGLIEDDIIAKSLRCFKGQQKLDSKLEHIFSTEERTESLRKLYYTYANGL